MGFDRFEIVDTYYWWLAEHHSGQWSTEYARLSKVTGYYKPSPLAHGPENPEAYAELCTRNECTHE